MLGTKGIFFSMDGLFAISMLFLAMITLPLITIKDNPTIINTAVLSQDSVNILAELNMSELKYTWVQEGIASGEIEATNSVLEQIGEYWATGDNRSENLTKILDIIGSYGVYINDEVIVSKNFTNNVFSARRMVSGIFKNVPIKGYVARAIVQKSGKNTTKIIKGDVVTSSVKKSRFGNNDNLVNITNIFELPKNITIHDAYWFIQQPYTDNQLRAFINGNLIPESYAIGNVLLKNLQSKFNEGFNNITVEGRFGGYGSEAGDDGSSHLVLAYETEAINTLNDLNIVPFAETKSHAPIKYKKFVVSMNEVNEIEVFLKVKGNSVSLTMEYEGVEYPVSTKTVVNGEVMWTNSEILTSGLTYSQLKGSYFSALVVIDPPYKTEIDSGDERIIYDGSEVRLKTNLKTEVYNKIDLSKVINVTSMSETFYTDYYHNLDWDFEHGKGEVLLLDAQLAWLSTGVETSQRVLANGQELFSDPPFILEFTRYGYNTPIINGNNTFALKFGDQYGIEPNNSLVNLIWLINGSVGYGPVFSTSQEAELDAVNRMKSVLGTEVGATISADAQNIGGVPTLWGPVFVEVRI